MSFLEQDVDSPGRAARPAPRLFVDSEVGPLRRVLLHRPRSRAEAAHTGEQGRAALRRCPLGETGARGARRLRRHARRSRRRSALPAGASRGGAGGRGRARRPHRAQLRGGNGCPRLRGPAQEWVDGLTAGEVASWLIGGIAWQDLPFQLPGPAGQVAMPGRVRARPAAEPHPHRRHVVLDLQRRLDQCDGRAGARRESLHLEAVYRHPPLFAAVEHERSGAMVCHCPRRWKAATSW